MANALLSMETVVGMLGDDDARSEDFPLQDTADPVVYQLVRVHSFIRR